MKTIVDLILRMAQDNPSWGYTRIRGALANLGHQVGRGTVANVLGEHGFQPAPQRDRHTRWVELVEEFKQIGGGKGGYWEDQGYE